MTAPDTPEPPAPAPAPATVPATLPTTEPAPFTEAEFQKWVAMYDHYNETKQSLQ